MTTTNDNYLGRATYSPDDNKLRIYPFARLSPEDYKTVRAAGYIWAPKQELFVAPMWTTGREDLAIQLCGEIEDEDTSLFERAEQRAERFEDYSEKRAADADRARAGVSAITDNIPLGQPILVGHHSEKRARKDAERIENGMRKAVNMWETSKYWTMRAAGAKAAANRKDLPRVRARRIKGLEADLRRVLRTKEGLEDSLKFWSIPNLTHELALKMAGRTEVGRFTLPKKEGDKPDWNYSPSAYDALAGNSPTLYAPRTLEEIVAVAKERFPKAITGQVRWENHYRFRIDYEKALLEEDGASSLLDRKPVPKKVPICNYRSPGGIECTSIYRREETMYFPQVEMTSAEYAAIPTDYKGTRVCENSHRIRTTMQNHHLVCVFLTDSKVHEKPEPIDNTKRDELLAQRLPVAAPAQMVKRAETSQADKEFEGMKQSLKAGVAVVSAPQLFPTPPALAARMVEMAQLHPDHRVLEPSAGSGNIVKAIIAGRTYCEKVMVEINPQLSATLQTLTPDEVICGDFLGLNGALGKFDRIVMNPPFVGGQDIVHIKHAATFLKPGGRLVALCANGPRQQKLLKAFAEDSGGTYEPLPADTFKEAGTGVNVALLVIEAAR